MPSICTTLKRPRRHRRYPPQERKQLAAEQAGVQAQLSAASAADGQRVVALPSGAGHDAMAMVALTDVAMLFLRCRDGISHHPAESITAEDAATGARVLQVFIERFAPRR